MAEVWCKQHGNIPYLEVSAKDDKNVKQTFMMAAEMIASRRTDMDDNGLNRAVDLKSTKKNYDQGCC